MDVLFSLALSLHLGMEGDYTDVHPHIRFQHKNIVSGIYYNSEDTISPYLGMQLKREDFFLEMGLVDGYSHSDDPYPFARAGYTFKKNISFFITPAVEVINNMKVYGAVIGLEFKL